MDILAALSDASPELGEKRCKLAQFLADIPKETPGRDALLEAAETYPSGRLVKVVTALGGSISATTIREHRRAECRCYR